MFSFMKVRRFLWSFFWQEENSAGFDRLMKLIVWDVPWRLPSSGRKRLVGCVVKELWALLIIIPWWSTSVYHSCRAGNHLIWMLHTGQFARYVLLSFSVFSVSLKNANIKYLTQMYKFSGNWPCKYILPKNCKTGRPKNFMHFDACANNLTSLCLNKKIQRFKYIFVT